MNKNALKSFLGNCSCIALLSDIRVTKMISQHTTYKDVGSAENAGAIFCHSIHGNTPKLFQTIFGVHSIHGDTPKLFQTIFGVHSIHGDTPKLFQTIFGVHSIHGDKNT